jgi:hypothetical protein
VPKPLVTQVEDFIKVLHQTQGIVEPIIVGKWVDTGYCSPYQREEECPNPNCKGYFAHNLVGMRGGDLPEGFREP